MKTTTLASIAIVAAVLGSNVPAGQDQDGAVVDWQARLTTTNLDEREAHFDELVRTATGDAELRARIDEWASGTGELAWTARLARRELERHDHSPSGDPFAGPWNRGRSPRDPFGDFDPFADFGRGFGFGGELDRLFEELRSRQPSFGGGSGGLGSSRHQGFSFQQTPDGVRIEIEQDVDGQTQTKVYEGETLEGLLQAHPELEEHFGGGGRWRFGAGVVPFAWGEPRFFPFDARGRDHRRPRPDVLGVRVSEAEGGGLLIHHVMRGSIAAALGLQPGETLVELDGRAIESVEDVATALAERARDARIVAKVTDPDGNERELEWTPKAEAREARGNPFPIDSTRRL